MACRRGGPPPTDEACGEGADSLRVVAPQGGDVSRCRASMKAANLLCFNPLSLLNLVISPCYSLAK
uniref:Uncharacterized protein n=1 Tax=Oryza barthii TaxID=65489 RepID=A0A0D3G7V1_9ORYZ